MAPCTLLAKQALQQSKAHSLTQIIDFHLVVGVASLCHPTQRLKLIAPLICHAALQIAYG